ncbi:MAG: T9SS type A sorting domain-containing protein, partial [Ignavibacteriales bacterium]|nr:T9SS type A sorting domain-containing protein [Ignavibacteriales bacterium]
EIRYQIPEVGGQNSEVGAVTLRVYDLLGNEVATLVNEEKQSGTYSVRFDPKGLSSGIYFYQLRAGKYADTKKMILLR